MNWDWEDLIAPALVLAIVALVTASIVGLFTGAFDTTVTYRGLCG